MSNSKTTTIANLREPLTDLEKSELKEMVLGYGNFAATAKRAGVHVETLRGVITRGYGEKETIKKIRRVFKKAGVKTEIKSTAA